MDLEALALLQHAGPLTLAALILVVGLRLGKLWSKVEELLANQREREQRFAEAEQRIAVLEAQVGE